MEKQYQRKVEVRSNTLVKGIKFVRGDVNVYTLELHLTQHGLPFEIPNEGEVLLTFSNVNSPNGTFVDKVFAEVLNPEKGIVSCTLAGNELNTSGTIFCSVEVITDSQKLTFEQKLQITMIDGLGEQGSSPPEQFIIWVDSVNAKLIDFENQLEEISQSGFSNLDNTLKVANGKLGVNTTNDVLQDNTLPITSAGVHTQIGNINALLELI